MTPQPVKSPDDPRLAAEVSARLRRLRSCLDRGTTPSRADELGNEPDPIEDALLAAFQADPQPVSEERFGELCRRVAEEHREELLARAARLLGGVS